MCLVAARAQNMVSLGGTILAQDDVKFMEKSIENILIESYYLNIYHMYKPAGRLYGIAADLSRQFGIKRNFEAAQKAALELVRRGE